MVSNVITLKNNEMGIPGSPRRMCPDARIRERVEGGSMKQLYSPEHHGKSHINASCRRSLILQKYKTVSLQNLWKQCHRGQGLSLRVKEGLFQCGA